MTQSEKEKAEILRRLDFYARSPARIRKQMVNVAHIDRLEKGTYYFHEEDDPAYVGLIHEGSLRVFKSVRSGREITLFHVESGELCVLNVMAILAGHRFPATSVAETPVCALMFPADDFTKWFETCLPVRQYVLELIAARFETLMTLIDEISFERMDRRLASFLLTRFGKTGDAGLLELTHEEIARELGSAREVIGRLLRDLENDGAVDLARGSIRLIDAVRLQGPHRRKPNTSKSG